MFCKNCGKSIGDGSQFCPYCGTKVGADNYENNAAGTKEETDSYDQVLDYDDIEATRVLSESNVRRDYGRQGSADSQGPHYSSNNGGSNYQNNYSGYTQQNTAGYTGYGQNAAGYNYGAQNNGNGAFQNNYGQNGNAGQWYGGYNSANQAGYNPNGYNTYNTPGQSAVNVQKPKKKLGKGAIIGISVGGGVALIAVIAVCVILFFNRSTYETPLKTMVGAINKGDVMEIMNVLPLEAIIDESDMSEYLLGMDYDDLVDLYVEQFESSFADDLIDTYGRDFKMDYKIYETENLSREELRDLNSDYTYSFGTEDDFISEAVRMDVDMSVEGSDGSDTENITLITTKVDGKWYLDMFSLE